MTQDSKTKLTPKLRFPEFRDAPGWVQAQIGDLAISESSTLALNKLSLTPSGYPVYGAAGCIGFINTFAQSEDYIAIVKDGSGVGRLYLIKGQSSILGTLAYLMLKTDSESLLAWLFYYLNSLDFRKFIKGSGIPHIYFSDYASQVAGIPSTAEQQKIADCLTSVDELISAQTRKVDALKTHKKGLMQQLFPREDETQPRLRFPEFRDAGERKRLGDLSQILRGGSPRPIDEYTTSDVDGLSWLKIGDVDQDSKYVTFTKERILVTALSKTREVNPGDLIMSNSMSFGRPYILKIKSCIHDGWIAVTKIDERVYRDYLYYLILSPTSQEYFLNNAAGSGVLNLNADIIKLLPVLIPKHLEQQKIADCLTSVDDLIAAQARKVDVLKAHKKGLMQQLFPTPEVNI